MVAVQQMRPGLESGLAAAITYAVAERPRPLSRSVTNLAEKALFPIAFGV